MAKVHLDAGAFSSDHSTRYADHCRVWWHVPDYHRTCTDLHIVPDGYVAQYLRTGADGHIVPDGGMPFPLAGAHSPKGNALEYGNVVPNYRCFSDDDADRMIDEESLSDGGAWMYVRTG